MTTNTSCSDFVKRLKTTVHSLVGYCWGPVACEKCFESQTTLVAHVLRVDSKSDTKALDRSRPERRAEGLNKMVLRSMHAARFCSAFFFWHFSSQNSS